MKFFKSPDNPIGYKAQYKALILKHHPDKGGDALSFREIQSEYKTLLFLYGVPTQTKSWADMLEEEEAMNEKVFLTEYTNRVLNG